MERASSIASSQASVSSCMPSCSLACAARVYSESGILSYGRQDPDIMLKCYRELDVVSGSAGSMGARLPDAESRIAEI